MGGKSADSGGYSFEMRWHDYGADLFPPITALDRLSQIGSQISGGASAGGKAKLLEKNPDDVRSRRA